MTKLALTTSPSVGGDLATAAAVLNNSLCSDQDAVSARERTLAFVATHHDALYRTCLDGHLTGSALVLNAERDRVLLMLHAKLGMWLQPGGHADGEGNLAAVALREAEEETGIVGLRIAEPAVDCDIHDIPARPGEPAHEHHDVRFVVLAPAGAVVAGNHESHALRWVSEDEAQGLATDKSLLRLIRNGLALAQSI